VNKKNRIFEDRSGRIYGQEEEEEEEEEKRP